MGADAWRRTGVLTFSYGKNQEVSGLKVTYKRIKEHLETKYQTKFSHGTIVQLCVARNKRRISAKRYKGVAKVTSRRARKGFALKLNPDAHYSTAMYSSLNKLQKKDGTVSLILNRDDAAGFRLDTTYTHRQHSVLSLSDDVEVAGSRDGAVVRALASHQCGAGSIPRLDVICGLSLLVLFSAPRGFSPGTPVFPSPQKPTFDLICIDLI